MNAKFIGRDKSFEANRWNRFILSELSKKNERNKGAKLFSK